MKNQLETTRTPQEFDGECTIWARFEPQLPDNSEWWLVDEDGTLHVNGLVSEDEKVHLTVGIPTAAQGQVSLHVRAADGVQINPNSVIESSGGLIIIDNLEIHEVMTRTTLEADRSTMTDGKRTL
jgi:hypothetical protein